MKKEKLLKQFGLRLKDLRLEKAITQENLANRCDLDRTYISGLERGLRNPSLTCIFRVANGLNIQVEALVREYDLEQIIEN